MQPTVKPRFSRHTALTVASELVSALAPFCECIIIAGSLRRKKQWVGDVEIVYISKSITNPDQGDFFRQQTLLLAELEIGAMLRNSLITQRINSARIPTWGDQNKLAIHTKSGVPVDLFRTTEANWFNYLVCRTGSSATNLSIATRAQQLGWKWNPYGPGFTTLAGDDSHEVTSEEDLFDFLRMPFLAPKDR